MGLSERKVKQRIGVDPRNLTWSEDKSRFSYKHMTALGWTDRSGLGGSDLSGNPNHIAVVQRLDNSGIGMARARKEGDDMSAGAGPAGRGLEDVLKRLAASASASPSPSPAPESPALSPSVSASETEVADRRLARNRIASRQKHLHSKRLASASPAALAEILGVPASALPAISSPSPTPALEIKSSSISVSATPADPAPPSLSATPAAPTREAEEEISTSTLSVSDYFQRKLREKMLARQAAASASGSVTPTLSEGSLALVREEVKVIVGGTEWEGSRMTFEETASNSAAAGPSSMPFTPSTSIDSDAPDTAKLSKEEKRAAKAARRVAKEAKRASKASRAAAPSDAEATEATKKRKRSERGDQISESTPVATDIGGVLGTGEDDGVPRTADPELNADKSNKKERKQKRDKGERSEKRAKKEKADRTVKPA